MSTAMRGHPQSWTFPVSLTIVLVATAIVYLFRWFRLRGPHLISGWRLTAFMSGLLLLWIALGSPLAALDHRWLTAHMVRHLLLMTICAPLILLGLPTLLFPSSTAVPATLRPFAAMLLCWIAGTATVIVWHVPSLFRLAMESDRWHVVESASFLLAGLFFWSPVIRNWPGPDKTPRWSSPVYLFLATLPCDILSAFLVFCGRVVFPSYLSVAQGFQMSPLQDQELAGALMWVFVTFAYLIPAAIITVLILSPTSQRSQRENQVQVPITGNI